MEKDGNLKEQHETKIHGQERMLFKDFDSLKRNESRQYTKSAS
jgi:hypothetical protein